MLYSSPAFAKSPELQQQLPSTVPFFAQQVTFSSDLLPLHHVAVILTVDLTVVANNALLALNVVT